MAKIRNKSGEDLVTLYGTAVADGLLEVPDAAVYGYTCQSIWEPNDKAATTAHNAGEKAERAAVAAARGPVNKEPDVEVPAEPAGAGGDPA